MIEVNTEELLLAILFDFISVHFFLINIEHVDT